METKKRGRKDKILRFVFYVVATIIILGNVLAIFSFMVFNQTMVKNFPHVSSLIFYILGFIAWANIIAIIGLLKSRKWGFWLFLGVAIVTIIVHLTQRLGAILNPLGPGNLMVNLLVTFGGLLGPLVVYLLIRYRWKQLK